MTAHRSRPPFTRRWLTSLAAAALCASGLCLAGETPLAAAQDEAAAATARRVAFDLSSSQIFTTKDSPAIDLTFQQLDHLDFRIYRIKDGAKFFASLKDPHHLGSAEPVVPQEQTWLERLAIWKADRRAEMRTFLRRQLTYSYRAERRKQSDQSTVKQRVALNQNAFAQVPLLNTAQLVSSWREILPNLRDAEYRRLPLDLPGKGVYLVEAVLPPHRAYTIVIVSDVGLVTKAAPGQALLFAANRFTGEPIANCAATLLVDKQVALTGTTGADGTTIGAIQAQKPESVIAMAQCGDDTVVTDPSAYSLRSSPRDLLGYIYTDKPIYRPGHTVKLKGVLRWREHDAIIPFDQPNAEVSIVDTDDKVLQRQTLKVDAFGAVSTSFVVPATAPLGYYTIRINVGDESASGNFEVQEYRKPEFEVGVSSAGRFIVQGGKAKVTIKARYYFGQPVANGAVKYALYKTGYYSPYRWRDSGEEGEYADDYFDANEQIGEEDVRLDAQGEATVDVDLPVDERQADYTLRIDARVTDASGREVSGKGSVIATHGDFMISGELDRYVYQPGAAAELRLRAIDYQGQPKANVPITIELARVNYARDGADGAEATPVLQGTVQTDAAGQAVWKMAFPKESGNFRFRATAPSAGRTIKDDTSAWISGYAQETSENDYDQYLELVADQKSYAPGQTARLLLRGAEMDATILVTKEAQTISWHEVKKVKGGDAIDVPITDADVGDTWVNIIFVKNDRVYRAERRLRVPETARTLNVSITAASAVAKPRDPGVFTIKTTDLAGAPVSAQVSLAVIDEAVYAVKPDSTPDPVRFFFRRSYSVVNTSFSREYAFYGYSSTQSILLAKLGGARRPFTLADFKGDKESRPHVRKEFPDAIFWAADIVTDAAGTATVKVSYPDALTTWRLTARAIAADTRGGAAISRTTVTKDVILRVITPRFLTEGDTLRLPTIAHNYLPEAKAMAVSVTAKGLTPLDATATTTRNVDIPSNGESRMEWPYKAQAVGTATITGTATTPGDGDAVEQSLPVLPYGIKRDAGTSGSTASGTDRTIDLTIPEQSNPAARSIQVALAPSMAGSMLSALDFLAEYPYGCTEQTVSSFFPNLMVMRALGDLKLAPTERLGSLDRMNADGLKRLYDLQHEDGGWGWWKTDQNHPFMTAYALWALVEAQHAGVRGVNTWRITQGVTAAEKLYAEYPKMVPELKAYMVYVLQQAKTLAPEQTSGSETPFDFAKAIDDLWSARDRMTPYGRTLLLLVLDAAKDARGDTLAPQVVAAAKTEGALSSWPSTNDPLLDDWGDTSVEATAMAIKALAPRMPNDPLIERAARYLLVNRAGGYYWSSTKTTAFALMGLLEQLRARGDKPGTLTVDVEVNGTKVGSQTFTPESWTMANPVLLTAPAQAGVNKVRIIPRSGGSVYWTATARYYDNRESLEPSGTRKLALSRKYFSLTPIKRKDGSIVYRETPFSGTARAGDLLLVRLVAAGSTDWRYVMLEDPLPAGVEAIREEDLYQLEKHETWWYGSQREYRDNRIVQFQSDFSNGRYEYTYLLKVVTPGSFKAMPAQITPMYVPDVFATTSTQSLDVPSGEPSSNAGAAPAAPPAAAPVAPPAGASQPDAGQPDASQPEGEAR
jgi:uncharacterized protein YfaS (alpha-2-macroglobulin family)